MSSKQVICFETSRSLQEAALKRAADEGVGMDELINRSLRAYLDDSRTNPADRRIYRRTPVDTGAVARPVALDGENFLQGEVRDVSLGGIRLHCACRAEDLERLVQEGGHMEIVFTVPGSVQPVCFTCEVRHIHRGGSPDLGCEFINATGDSFLALKKALDIRPNCPS